MYGGGGCLSAALRLQLLLLAPLPHLGTIGEISRNSPSRWQPISCRGGGRRTRVSHNPGAGNHAEVVWKLCRGRGGGVWVSLSLQSLVSSSISSPTLRKGGELWHKVLLVASVRFSNPDFHGLSCLAHFVSHGCSTETKEAAQTETAVQMGFLFANSALLPSAPPFCSQSRAPADHGVCPHQH